MKNNELCARSLRGGVTCMFEKEATPTNSRIPYRIGSGIQTRNGSMGIDKANNTPTKNPVTRCSLRWAIIRVSINT